MIMDGYRKGVNVGGWLSRNWKANGWIGNCCAPSGRSQEVPIPTSSSALLRGVRDRRSRGSDQPVEGAYSIVDQIRQVWQIRRER